jgi:hypothetical protein
MAAIDPVDALRDGFSGELLVPRRAALQWRPP